MLDTWMCPLHVGYEGTAPTRQVVSLQYLECRFRIMDCHPVAYVSAILRILIALTLAVLEATWAFSCYSLRHCWFPSLSVSFRLFSLIVQHREWQLQSPSEEQLCLRTLPLIRPEKPCPNHRLCTTSLRYSATHFFFLDKHVPPKPSRTVIGFKTRAPS